MSVPTILQHTDTGAPTLNGTDGSLYDVLKWALPQLGWTIEFDNSTDKIAFRNDNLSGSGYYFQVTDAAADHLGGDARRAKVSGFSAMTALDTGSDEFPIAAEKYFFKSHSLDATAREWFIIGNETIFYLGTFNPDTDRSLGYRVFWAGDSVPYSVNDPSPFTIGAYINSGNSGNDTVTPIGAVTYGGSFNAPPADDEIFAIHFDDLSAGQTAGYLSASVGVDGANESDIIGKPGTIGVYPDPITQSLNSSRLELLIETPVGSTNWHRRATLPGILIPMSSVEYQSGSPFTNLQTVSGISNGNQLVDVMLVYASSEHGTTNGFSGKQAFLFDITSDWSNW